MSSGDPGFSALYYLVNLKANHNFHLTIQSMKQTILVFALGWLLIHAGCRKNNPDPDNGGTGLPIMDTAWAYTQDLYLWYKFLPGNLNIRSYSDPNELMKAIRKYSTEPGFSGPVDRWSFALKKSEWDDISAAITTDFGINIFFKTDSDLRVSHVEPGSPAYEAGVRRSWRITGVNGNTTINTQDATIQRIVTAVYNSSAVQLDFVKPDGNGQSLALSAAQYAENPVYLDSIYQVGAKKVGYLVYTSFLGNIQTVKNRFASVFNNFSSEDIDELIIDLRYNGGGYVELQNELANYLVPAAGDKGTMIKQQFNDKYGALLDTTIHFSKKGSLNLDRVFFITTKNSASASELLINSLQPYIETKLVGKPTTGKAVGYFNIGVGDWYIFPVSFRSLNKNNEGNYFDGLAVEANVNDGLDKGWGDTEEACLASALHYIGTGSYSNISPRHQPDILLEENNDLLNRRFKGAIEQKKIR